MSKRTLNFHTVTLVISGFLLSFCLASQAEPSIAPAFNLPGIDNSIQLSDYRGKVIYLDFWASWCGPCRQSFPWMAKMQSKYRNQGLVIIAINLDQDRKLADQFLAQFSSNFLIGFDKKGVSPMAYGVRAMPSTFIINRQGHIISQHIGFNHNKEGIYEQSILTSLTDNPDS